MASNPHPWLLDLEEKVGSKLIVKRRAMFGKVSLPCGVASLPTNVGQINVNSLKGNEAQLLQSEANCSSVGKKV